MIANPDDQPQRGGADDPPSSPPAPSVPETSDEPGFLPSQPDRRRPESLLVRVVATAGIVGIGTALGAILGASDVDAWILSLVVAIVSVLLAAVLWRSRTL